MFSLFLCHNSHTHKRLISLPLSLSLVHARVISFSLTHLLLTYKNESDSHTHAYTHTRRFDSVLDPDYMIKHGTTLLVHVGVAVKDKVDQISSSKPLLSPINEAGSEGPGVAIDGNGKGASGGGNGASGDEQAVDKNAGREQGSVHVGNGCSGDGTGLSQIDSMTARNSATACTSSDLNDATAHDLNPKTGATTAPGQSASLVGSGSKGLDDFSAIVQASEPNASQTSGYESRGTSSSKPGSKEEASDMGDVTIGGQAGIWKSSGVAGVEESKTQTQSAGGEADGGNSAGEGLTSHEDADKDPKHKGGHDAEKDSMEQEVFTVHLESDTVLFIDDSAHEGQYQVGPPLVWSCK